MRAVRRGFMCAVGAVVLAGCSGDDRAPAVKTSDDMNRTAMEALIAFARTPDEKSWAAVPLADSVSLGLGDSLRARRTARELLRPSRWRLNVNLFRARAGTVSALDLIASEEGALRITHGPHPHCASPPVAPPPRIAGFQRVVVQPRDPDGCLAWWTVDAFVDDQGRIRAVTLDLWEP